MRGRQLLTGIISLALLWHVAAWILASPLLPGPLTVLQTLVTALVEGKLWQHLLVSTWRILAGITIALFLGTPVGLILGQSNRLRTFFAPVIYLTYPIPKVVLLPILLLLFGTGDTSKIILIALILFFQILVVVRDEAAAIRPELIASIRSLGSGRLALFRFVYLPATLPAVFTALRVSIGTAVSVLFFTESFATTSGLGYYILIESWGRIAYDEMYAGVVALSLLGLTLYYLADWAERKIAPWRYLE